MKGVTLPTVLMLHLAVPWLCLASPAAFPPVTSSEHTAAVLEDYIPVKFSTASATPEMYRSFIASVRAGLVRKAEKSHGIPVLLSEDDPLAPETYVLISLLNRAGHSITLKMDVTGAYFTAYRAGNYSCLLKRSGSEVSAICYDDPEPNLAGMVMEPSSRDSFPAGNGDVSGEVARWRVRDLDGAISSMFLFPTGKATAGELRRGVAACDMVIAGAAMSPYIERWMSAGMWSWNGVSDDPSLHGLQERWLALSAAVQESHQGVFAAPVTIRRSSGELLPVDNVRRAIPLLAFLHHKNCTEPLQVSTPSSQVPMLIRSVVPEPDMGGRAPICNESEPTTRILGPGGKCVDVYNGFYDNGSPVQLWPCKESGYVNQLWTFKSDGTIRSNGMCLTSNGSVAGASVMIYDCPRNPTATARHVLWEVRDDGAIVLRMPGRLVLSAGSTASHTVLTVRHDDRGTGQCWTPTNDTAPFVTTILGFHDLCLQVDEAGEVLSAPCGAGVEWALHPDGSVRPHRGSGCLAPGANGRVVVSRCDLAGSSHQRWVFRNDGTVLNSGTGWVMDVRPRCIEPGCFNQQIREWWVVVSPARGVDTQNWSIML